MHNAAMMNRRQWLQACTAAGVGAFLTPTWAGGAPLSRLSGERLPAVGLGSWITFDHPPGPGRDAAYGVIEAFLEQGGGVIDSSPMYGHAQQVIGEGLQRSSNGPAAFSATKVWVRGREAGEYQMEQAFSLWGRSRLDLVHVHNMVDWRTHLPWLQAWRDEERIRYLGITTSHGRRHGEMAEVIRSQPFDAVQFTYNLADREAEQRLLPMALAQGKAVIINRPFQGGYLFQRVAGRPLPPWAGEWRIDNWAQFFLKFIISHPAVTCAIPATSRQDHLLENMAAMQGPLPTAEVRADMVAWFERVVN